MTPHATTTANGNPPSPLSAAARFWEPRRLFYNLALSATVIFWLAISWPHFRPAMTLSSLGYLCFLALLANILYCAAYFADLGIQQLSNTTRRCARSILWTLGTLFAILLASYWINDEIYPAFPNATLTFFRSIILC